MGLDADYGIIVQHLKEWFDRSAGPGLRPLRGLLRMPAFLAARVLGDAQIFVGLLEDMPYPENRVVLDPARPGSDPLRVHDVGRAARTARGVPHVAAQDFGAGSGRSSSYASPS